MTLFLRSFLCVKQKVDDSGIRTPNRLIRSQTPYPLGHEARCLVNCICYLFICQVLSLVLTLFLRSFLCVKQKSRRQQDSNTLSSDSKSDASSVGPCGHVFCRLYLLLVQLPSVVSISKKFPLCQAKSRPLRDSNPNLLIRSQTPYPWGLAVMYPVNCICYLFSCQVLSLVLTLFLRSFLCVKQKVDLRGIRTPSLLIRSQTPYPLGHASCQLYLLLVQLPSVVPYIHILCKNFPLCQTKCRTERDSNPQSSDSKSDAICNAAMYPVNCMLRIQLPSVVPCVDSIFEKFSLCQAKSRPQMDSTPNILNRSQTPYPLGHAAMYPVDCICCLFSCQVLSPFLRSFLCVKQKVDHCGIRTPIF